MRPISRRTVLGGTVAAAVAGSTALPASAADVQIADAAQTITLVASPDTGEVRVLDAGGVQRLALTGFEYVYMSGDTKVTQRTTGITSVELVGAQQFVITCTAPVGQILGTFTVGLRKARIRWDVSGVANLRTDGFRIKRAVSGTATEHYDPIALWSRDRDPGTGALRGGVPFETGNGVCYSYAWSDNRAVIRFPQSTVAFSNNGYLHVVGDAGGVDASIVLGVMRPHSAGVIARDGDLGIEVWTAQPFNLWNTGGAKTVQLQVSNASLTTRNVRVDWVARDWNGGSTTGTASAAVGARGIWNATFSVTLGARDIHFVEAVVYDGTTEAAFARTTLAVLSTYTYSATSMFGMGNYPFIEEPSSAAVLGLMRLVGMKWVRTAYNKYGKIAASPGPGPQELSDAGFLHNVQLGGELPVGVDGTAWADDMVGRVLDAKAQYYECANELNLGTTTPQQYVDDVLKPLRKAMTAKGATFKVMTCGFGGYPEQWLADFGTAGGWDQVDVLAYHPGRGNYVADYDPPAPWTNQTRWNFLGTLKKATTAKGSKELWLTEAYAFTLPNRWWADTCRNAAENVLLQLALATAYGVTGVNWYTLFDSIEQQPMEANPDSDQYHYGLLHRDLGAKPSLLAFATAARWLGNSTFAGAADLGDPNLFGLVFDTPAGKVNLLWSRKDGYLLNTDPARRVASSPAYYRSPEPWEDLWPTKTDVLVPTPAATTSVRELNCLGTDVATHQASNAQVTVALDGSPRIFIGLALPLKTTGGTP